MSCFKPSESRAEGPKLRCQSRLMRTDSVSGDEMRGSRLLFITKILNCFKDLFMTPPPIPPRSVGCSRETKKNKTFLPSPNGNNRLRPRYFYFPAGESERWPDWIPLIKVRLWIQGRGKSEENILQWYPLGPERAGASPHCFVACW